ncbi:hypothetical protein ABZR86_01350 [Dyella marensis]|uniref:Uncharacterized protein n=1 Tax=Dyella marensis TaxID=500610 RepID=A0A1I2ANL5_9GAMM|nr:MULTISPECIES: hypothetical protein [Dyella]SFE45635.1 hypothetical protein SAMN02799615_01096 [Dyella marensis]
MQASLVRPGALALALLASGAADARATPLAACADIPFEQQADGLHLRLPTAPTGLHAHAYRIELH